ncbi:MAG: hypothetical protein PHT33_01485 [bacterium]|nr:hypothetical protein [bacterium]
MDIDKQQQNWEVWGAALVVSLAVTAGLLFRGISGETVADAVKDIGAALIPILSAFVTARLVVGRMDPSERFMMAGETALSDLRKRHADILSGPKASREDYDPEKPGKAGRYLFVQLAGQKNKAQFIPMLPLRDGIVEICVSKTTTMLLLGAERGAAEEAQTGAFASVREAVEKLLQRNWPDVHEVLPCKHSDIAIIISFGPKKNGARDFIIGVYNDPERLGPALDEGQRRIKIALEGKVKQGKDSKHWPYYRMCEKPYDNWMDEKNLMKLFANKGEQAAANITEKMIAIAKVTEDVIDTIVSDWRVKQTL